MDLLSRLIMRPLPLQHPHRTRLRRRPRFDPECRECIMGMLSPRRGGSIVWLGAPDSPIVPCRLMETRGCPAAYDGPCGDRPCARFESDDPAPWLPGSDGASKSDTA